MTSDENCLDLMDLFRRDMTGIASTRAWHDDDPHPAFKQRPTVFKYEQSTYLFRVWMAGRTQTSDGADCLPFPGYPPVPEDRKLAPSDGALTNEPVAYIDPAHLKTMGKTATGSASCVIFNSSQGGCLKPLYCDTPAPASVVMPTDEDFYKFMDDYRLEKTPYWTWRACLYRVKELNS